MPYSNACWSRHRCLRCWSSSAAFSLWLVPSFVLCCQDSSCCQVTSYRYAARSLLIESSESPHMCTLNWMWVLEFTSEDCHSNTASILLLLAGLIWGSNAWCNSEYSVKEYEWKLQTVIYGTVVLITFQNFFKVRFPSSANCNVYWEYLAFPLDLCPLPPLPKKQKPKLIALNLFQHLSSRPV